MADSSLVAMFVPKSSPSPIEDKKKKKKKNRGSGSNKVVKDMNQTKKEESTFTRRQRKIKRLVSSIDNERLEERERGEGSKSVMILTNIDFTEWASTYFFSKSKLADSSAFQSH